MDSNGENLHLNAEPRSGESILDSRKGPLRFADDLLDQPTLPEGEWNPSL